MGYNFNFLSNNVNGLNSSKKRIKMLEYFREKIANNGILSLQETHSSHDSHQRNYEIRKFTIGFSKDKAKLKREKLPRLEVKLRELEENLKLVPAIF